MTSRVKTTYGNRIAWFDVETTSLDLDDPDTLLLEVGTAITDLQLNLIATMGVVIKHTMQEVFAIAKWCPAAADMHIAQRGGSGLADDCVFDELALPCREAEAKLLAFVAKHTEVNLVRAPHTPGEGSGRFNAPIWGGCSPQIDRTMIKRHMPRLYERIHYRTLDASTLREAMRQWGGVDTPRASSPHRAVEDAVSASQLAGVFRSYLRAGRKFRARA